MLNPNGIIFGRNAQLAIGGAFVGSTANRLQFADGTEFGVGDQPGTLVQSSLLTLSTPVGLHLGTNPGNIQVNGNGNTEIFPTTNFGLAVAPGRSFSLVGGNIQFDGGIITASRIDLSSVADGTVQLVANPLGWQVTTDGIADYRDIQMANRSLLWSPYPVINPSDGIRLQGRDIRLDNAQVATVATSSRNSSPISVNATNSLDLRGVSSQAYPFSSWITTQVNEGATGQGGRIQITAPNLSLQDGAMIQTATQGNGRAGDVQVQAGNIQIRGFSPLSDNPDLAALLLNSRIASETSAAGDGGNIQVSGDRINFQNGGQVRVLGAPNSTGNPGNIRVEVTGRITAREAYAVNPLIPSGVSSLNFGAGNGGDITVIGQHLTLRNGGALFSFNQSSGQGGDLTVRMRGAIDARRTNPRTPVLSSALNASTFGSGNGGQISVTAQRINIQDGAEIATYTLSQLNDITFPGAGTGNAGNLDIRAKDITVQGTSPLTAARASVITSITLGQGNGGNVRVSAQRVRVLDAGSMATGVLPTLSLFGTAIPGAGSGQGGNLQVNATESIEVIGTRDFENSDLGAYSFGAGDAGQVRVQTSFLLVQDGGTVATAAIGVGNAGRMTINADTIEVRGFRNNDQSTGIRANATIPSAQFRRAYLAPPAPTGDTGTLQINTRHLSLIEGGEISVDHEGSGNAGRLSIRANILTNQGGDIRAATASGLGGQINLQVQDRLILRDQAQLTATAGGTGNGGNIAINSPLIVAIENSDIVANAERGRGGNIAIASQGIFGTAYRPQLTGQSDITASSQFNLAGSVTITTPNLDPTSALVELPEEVTDSSQRIATTCAASQSNTFVMTGRGGRPETPRDLMAGDRPWSDLRDPEISPSVVQSPTFQSATDQNLSSPVTVSPLVEATHWSLNAQGKMELISNPQSESREALNGQLGANCS